MDPKALCDWLDARIAETKRHLSRTTDKITVANLIGKIEAWEAMQVHIVKAAHTK